MSGWQERVAGSAAIQRTIMKNVYLWMAGGLALTGAVAYLVQSSQNLVRTLYGNPLLFFGLIIAEFALVIYLSRRIMTMSPQAATGAFIAYAALNGVTLSMILLVYTGVVVSNAFFVTAGTFAGMSLYALTTKKDLSSWGTYLFMGLWGIILASIVNFFLRSEMLYYLVSYIGVVLFMGLTAYDTQKIKAMSDRMTASASEADFVRLSIIGALRLYLDFINLFLFFLRIMGMRR